MSRLLCRSNSRHHTSGSLGSQANTFGVKELFDERDGKGTEDEEDSWVKERHERHVFDDDAYGPDGRHAENEAGKGQEGVPHEAPDLVEPASVFFFHRWGEATTICSRLGDFL